MPGPVAEALSSPVAGKPGLPRGFVASVLDAMGSSLERRMGMSQGELWREFLREALTTAPMAIGRAPVAMPNTIGVPMHPGAANLPPAWATARKGFGNTPWGMGMDRVTGPWEVGPALTFGPNTQWNIPRPNLPPTANSNARGFMTFPGGRQ